jgi:geranylgeranyl diphosphate synthase, type I
MKEMFRQSREAILDCLTGDVQRRRQVFDRVSTRWGGDSLDRLLEFTSRGKMIRGCLVDLGFQLAGQQPDLPEARQITAQVGAAMELFQSGLLIHDDIMDRDLQRRGKPTLHVAYAQDLQQTAFDEPAHNGQSLAICAGDLAYFWAFELLGSDPVPIPMRSVLQTMSARELALVGLAQMQDVCNGAHGQRATLVEPDEAAILEVFRYKTGRYTFSLPLSMGARLAGMSESDCLQLEKAGEYLGMLFQIKDDELGLFADPAVLGKPVGADVRENKKTLYRYRLLQALHARNDDRALAVKKAFGSPEAGLAELELIRDLLVQTGIKEELARLMESFANETRVLLEIILERASQPASTSMLALIDYSLNRES